MAEQSDVEALRERVDRLEQALADQSEPDAQLTPSRRGLLQAGGLLAGGGVLGALGTDRARAANGTNDSSVGAVGASGDSVDVYLDQLRDPNGDEVVNIDATGAINAAASGREWRFDSVKASVVNNADYWVDPVASEINQVISEISTGTIAVRPNETLENTNGRYEVDEQIVVDTESIEVAFTGGVVLTKSDSYTGGSEIISIQADSATVRHPQTHDGGIQVVGGGRIRLVKPTVSGTPTYGVRIGGDLATAWTEVVSPVVEGAQDSCIFFDGRTNWQNHNMVTGSSRLRGDANQGSSDIIKYDNGSNGNSLQENIVRGADATSGNNAVALYGDSEVTDNRVELRIERGKLSNTVYVGSEVSLNNKVDFLQSKVYPDTIAGTDIGRLESPGPFGFSHVTKFDLAPKYEDHFVEPSLSAFWSESGTGELNFPDQNRGFVEIAGGTSAGDVKRIEAAQERNFPRMTGLRIGRFIVKNNSGCKYRLGLVNQTPDRVMIQFDPANSANWEFVVEDSDGSRTIDTGIPVETGDEFNNLYDVFLTVGSTGARLRLQRLDTEDVFTAVESINNSDVYYRPFLESENNADGNYRQLQVDYLAVGTSGNIL